jgi:hypothetical protein
VQCRSDDDGESFSPTRVVGELPEPFNGCQGSAVGGVNAVNGTVYLSHPNPQVNEGIAPEILSLLGGNVNLVRNCMRVWG